MIYLKKYIGESFESLLADSIVHGYGRFKPYTRYRNCLEGLVLPYQSCGTNEDFITLIIYPDFHNVKQTAICHDSIFTESYLRIVGEVKISDIVISGLNKSVSVVGIFH